MMNQLGQYTRFVHEKLELAFLNFVQQFRKVYIGESTYRASKVYKRLSEMLHLSDQNEVLEAIIQKMYVL
jgi:exportin-7